MRSRVATSLVLCGASHGAKNAETKHTTVTTKAATVTGEVRKLWKTSLSKNRRRRSAARETGSVAAPGQGPVPAANSGVLSLRRGRAAEPVV